MKTFFLYYIVYLILFDLICCSYASATPLPPGQQVGVCEDINQCNRDFFEVPNNGQIQLGCYLQLEDNGKQACEACEYKKEGNRYRCELPCVARQVQETTLIRCVHVGSIGLIPTMSPEKEPTMSPTKSPQQNNKEEGDSMTTIIIASSVGGVVFLAIVTVLGLKLKQNKKGVKLSDDDENDALERNFENEPRARRPASLEKIFGRKPPGPPADSPKP